MSLLERIESVIRAITETTDEERQQELREHLRELQQLWYEEVTSG